MNGEQEPGLAPRAVPDTAIADVPGVAVIRPDPTGPGAGEPSGVWPEDPQLPGLEEARQDIRDLCHQLGLHRRGAAAEQRAAP